MSRPRTAPTLTPRSTVCALVPHYACEDWLDQAIESLLDQTRPPDAIVVIDDGSPQPPTEIVRRHPGVTLLAADDNGGPYRLVQAVADSTSFDAYLFQDADDWSAPDRLEILLETAAETGAELVGSHEVRILVEEGDAVPVRYPLDVNAALRAQPTAFPLLHPTSLISSSLLRRLGGFATGMRFSGDAELLRRAGHAARVLNADHFGYFRRKRAGSLTLGSETALGSPVRRAVQAVLADRARENARRVEVGQPPDLRPWRVAAPPRLRRLAGPEVRGAAPRTAPSRPALPKPDRPTRLRAQGRPGTTDGPVFVIGASRSGEAVLSWALAQHPRLGLLHDSRWFARAVADVEARAAHQVAPPPPGLRDGLATALLSLAAPPRSRRLVASGPELAAVGHALASLYPHARFVHVVRDVDEVVAALRASPSSGGAFHTAEAAWRSWMSATEAGLALEEALGADTVLRVRHGDLLARPEQAMRRCLTFLGESDHHACLGPLRDLARAPFADGADDAPSALVARARELSRGLRGPQPVAAASAAARRRLEERFLRRWAEGRSDGETLVERMCAQIRSSVPEGCTVAVVSRGDPRLVELDGRTGWHLPQVGGGVYAGHHPADSDHAVAEVQRLHARGAEYLAIPAPGLWWLSWYEGLGRHLRDAATLVSFHEEVGAVFRLAVGPAPVAGAEPRPPRFVPEDTCFDRVRMP